MDLFRKYLSSKMEHITSSLLWGNNRNQHHNTYYHYAYHGLQTLVHPEEKKLPGKILHCYNIPKTTTPTSTSKQQYKSWSSLWSSSSPVVKPTVMGDLIGTESGDCMSCDIGEVQVEISKGKSRIESRRKIRRKWEFPPSITLMRETGRMPWSFRREYSEEDGKRRLIIAAERVRRYEYVKADRENGRLTMKLVYEDDDEDGCCEECGSPIDEFGFSAVKNANIHGDLEEVEEESDFEFEFDFEDRELSKKSKENKLCGTLSQCVSYAGGDSIDGGLFWDSDNSLWVGNANNYLGQPGAGSAPLQPMTPVM